MKKIKDYIKGSYTKIKTSFALTAVMLLASATSVSADTNIGVDTEEAKTFIKAFTDPIKDILIWIVPAAAIIGALIMGVSYFFKNEQEREDYDIVPKLIKMGLIASVLQSIAVLFKIFGVSA